MKSKFMRIYLKISNEIIFILLLYSIFLVEKINLNKKYTKFLNILPRINTQKDVPSCLEDIFNSRELFISDSDLTGNYIKYIRPINKSEEKQIKKKYSDNELIISSDYFQKRENQFDYKKFVKLCEEEKLIDSNKIIYDNKPFISVIIASFNRENLILKSIRSIQNQSFKNIEIIIVDDGSKDNSTIKYKYLLETDPRIRIFTHEYNLGLWRTRLDGALYSRAKYLIFFDLGDFYEDNYVLEDYYKLIEEYKIDSFKMIFRLIYNYDLINYTRIPFRLKGNSKIVFGSKNIENLNFKVFDGWGNIWNRIIRANIYFKSLSLINDKVLNVYFNSKEDFYYNKIINKVSASFLVVNRIAYIYYYDIEGEGKLQIKTEKQKNKSIQQCISDLYYIYNFLPRNSNKKKIIKKLYEYSSEKKKYKLSYFKSRFYLLNNLIKILLEDPYIEKDDKIFLKKILNESLIREGNIKTKKFILI
jgi:glycosyltransferase involved in cell wall biosynthesis